MSAHRELLDALEVRLGSLEFGAMARGLGAIVVRRTGADRLTVARASGPALWDLEIVPLGVAEAPDARPRLLIRSAVGGPTYADHAVEGLAMSVFAMLLAGQGARTGAG